jgi:hypothetical protein
MCHVPKSACEVRSKRVLDECASAYKSTCEVQCNHRPVEYRLPGFNLSLHMLF